MWKYYYYFLTRYLWEQYYSRWTFFCGKFQWKISDFFSSVLYMNCFNLKVEILTHKFELYSYLATNFESLLKYSREICNINFIMIIILSLHNTSYNHQHWSLPLYHILMVVNPHYHLPTPLATTIALYLDYQPPPSRAFTTTSKKLAPLDTTIITPPLHCQW